MHIALVSVHIMSEPTKAKGIRLPETLWDAIEAEAQAMQMSTNEWLRRRLEAALSRPKLVQISSRAVQNADIVFAEER